MLLSEYDLQFASLDSEMIHLIPRLSGHVDIGILDKGKPLGLLGVVIPRDVDVADMADTSKRHLQVQRIDLRTNVPNQKRNSGGALATPTFPPIATRATTTTGGRAAMAVRIASWTSHWAVLVVVAFIRWWPSPWSEVAARWASSVVPSSASVKIIGGAITRRRSSASKTVPTASSSLIVVVIMNVEGRY